MWRAMAAVACDAGRANFGDGAVGWGDARCACANPPPSPHQLLQPAPPTWYFRPSSPNFWPSPTNFWLSPPTFGRHPSTLFIYIAAVGANVHGNSLPCRVGMVRWRNNFPDPIVLAENKFKAAWCALRGRPQMPIKTRFVVEIMLAPQTPNTCLSWW